MISDEDRAITALEGILREAEKQHYVTLHDLLEQHSMQWLVDVYQMRYPNVIAISIPILLSGYPDMASAPDPIDMHGRSWEQIERSIQRAVSDYLR